MKRILKTFFLYCVMYLLFGHILGQTVIFWTDNVDALPIKVYMNGRYIGSITKAYYHAPKCHTSGCVTIQLPSKSNTWRAVSESLGAETSGNYNLSTGCYPFQLFASGRKINTNNPPPPPPPPPPKPELAPIALAVVIAEVLLNSDFYVSGTLSSQYGGLEFGFRNNWNKHISLEQTVVWRYAFYQSIPHFLHTDNYEMLPLNNYDYSYNHSHRKRSNWGCDFRLVYNFFDRDYTFRNTNFMLNPYVGFGCDYMQYDGFFTSAVAGFTFGSKRVKMDCRYTFGYDFSNQSIVVNQLQLGIIVAYQYRRFGFFRKKR